MTATHYVGAVLTTKDYLVNTNTVHNLQLVVLIVGFLLRTGQKFNFFKIFDTCEVKLNRWYYLQYLQTIKPNKVSISFSQTMNQANSKNKPEDQHAIATPLCVQLQASSLGLSLSEA